MIKDCLRVWAHWSIGSDVWVISIYSSTTWDNCVDPRRWYIRNRGIIGMWYFGSFFITLGNSSNFSPTILRLIVLITLDLRLCWSSLLWDMLHLVLMIEFIYKIDCLIIHSRNFFKICTITSTLCIRILVACDHSFIDLRQSTTALLLWVWQLSFILCFTSTSYWVERNIVICEGVYLRVIWTSTYEIFRTHAEVSFLTSSMMIAHSIDASLLFIILLQLVLVFRRRLCFGSLYTNWIAKNVLCTWSLHSTIGFEPSVNIWRSFLLSTYLPMNPLKSRTKVVWDLYWGRRILKNISFDGRESIHSTCSLRIILACSIVQLFTLSSSHLPRRVRFFL